jgi:hypothetical protein
LTDEEIYEKAARRAKANSVDMTMYSNIIIFLEKEIDDYRAKIQRMEAYIDGANERAVILAQQPTTLEAVQENTTTEIIKALSDNGYNTITINCYKEIESEV